jgi:GNAT superfamily N-acetyltransferase
MAEIERLIGATVEIRVESPGSIDARHCLDAYFNELALRFEMGFDPDQSISAREEELTPPAGYFVIARIDGRTVGCGALKVKDGRIGEIKRMWTAESKRGLGIARRILETLEAKASELGIKMLRLETNKALHELRPYIGSRAFQ